MNIQQFYQKSAAISLNASLVALIPPFFLIIFGILILPNRIYIIIIIPFLVYSFFCYQTFLINKRRSLEVTTLITERQAPLDLFQENEVGVAFLPAPSLRMIIFSGDGVQIGEVKDMKFLPFRWLLPKSLDKLFDKKYGIYDESNQLKAFFLLMKDKIIIKPEDEKLKPLIIRKCKINQTNYFLLDEDKKLEIKQSSLYIDFQIYESNKMISRLRKGWLPLEWEKVFKNPNTPILSFEKTLNQHERLAIYAIISHYLRYSDH